MMQLCISEACIDPHLQPAGLIHSPFPGEEHRHQGLVSAQGDKDFS